MPTLLKNKKFFGLLGITLILITFFAPLTAHVTYADTKKDVNNALLLAADGCSLWANSILESCITAAVAWILLFLTWVMGMVLFVVNLIFEFILQFSIVRFKELAGIADVGWSAIRDVSNIFFIFILLYIAIKTVLDVGGDTKKLILRVILAALLINFSGALARVVIDSGNVLTLMFWESAKGKDSGGKTGTIGARIINGIELVRVSGLAKAPPGLPEDVGVPSASPTETIGFWTIVIQGIGGLIFVLVTIFLLGIATYMFVRRALYLVFLIMVSPFAFLIFAFQGFTGAASKWWSTLVCHTFFAPIFMVLFSVSIKVVESAGKILMPEGKDPDLVPQLVFFVIATALLFSSLLAANSLGCTGAVGAAAWAGKKFKDYGKRTAAWTGRNTLGWGAAKIASSERVRAMAERAQKVPGLGAAARAATGGLRGVAGAGFGGKKGGFVQAQKDAVKAKTGFATYLEEGASMGAMELKALKTNYKKTLKSKAAGEKEKTAAAGGVAGGVAGGTLGAVFGGPLGAAVGAHLGGGLGAAIGGLAGRASPISAVALKTLMKGATKGKIEDKQKEKEELKKDLKVAKETGNQDEIARLTTAINVLDHDLQDLQRTEEQELAAKKATATGGGVATGEVRVNDAKAQTNTGGNARGLLSRMGRKLRRGATTLGMRRGMAVAEPEAPMTPRDVTGQTNDARQEREQRTAELTKIMSERANAARDAERANAFGMKEQVKAKEDLLAQLENKEREAREKLRNLGQIPPSAT